MKKFLWLIPCALNGLSVSLIMHFSHIPEQYGWLIALQAVIGFFLGMIVAHIDED